MEHVLHILHRYALERPDDVALIAPGGATHTFGSLHHRVGRLAGGMAKHGVGPGTRIVVLLPIGPPLYEVLLALFHVGATAVLIDPQAGLKRMGIALRGVGVHGLIGPPKAHLLRLTTPALRGGRLYASTGLSALPTTRLDRLDGEPPALANPPEGEPALITFTTGTTGTPKAIPREHSILLAQHHMLAHHMGIGPGDVDLPTMPVFLLNSLAAGVQCVLPDGDLRDVSALDPASIAQQLDAHGVTVISGAPAFFEPLSAWLSEAKRAVNTVRAVFVGGARVEPELLASLRAVFPRARVQVLYGSSEAEPMAAIDADDVLALHDPRGACVGAPVPALSVRVDLLRTDGIGELLVAGPHVTRSYYKNPAAVAANKVIEGDVVWHRTGDAGWIDDEGRLWLAGRAAHIIGGLLPFEVERAAELVPGVERAALVHHDGGPAVAYSGAAAPAAIAQATGVSRVVRLDHIPMDRRHRSKIDHEGLATLLSGR